ncbi:MAG: hypothetical protein COB04_01415 [Gammaproteobacteria bacterium]|nr:MAG: hypothetical protein COB04_01415 [Gammaproteobacteria bacterium]
MPIDANHDTSHDTTPYANHYIDRLKSTAPKNNRLYMIVDGAQNPEIMARIEQSDELVSSLYSLDTAPRLKAVGPWILQVQKDEPLAAWIIEQGANQNWFITFSSLGKTLDYLRRQFRRIAIVKETSDTDAKDKHLYFRYYDPRVLRTFLPSCSERQRRYIFDDINCFWAQGDDLEKVLQFHPDGKENALNMQHIPEDWLSEEPNPPLR